MALWLACLPVGAEAAMAIAGRDSAAAAARPGWTEQPRVVMLRSALVPGWGQWHNGSKLKAALVAGAETWLLTAIVRDNNSLDGLRAEVDSAASGGGQRYLTAVNSYNAALDRLVARQWLLGGVVAYALVDAYVDANFRNFDVEFKTDPALPEGVPPSPAAPRRGATGGGLMLRAAFRWHF